MRGVENEEWPEPMESTTRFEKRETARRREGSQITMISYREIELVTHTLLSPFAWTTWCGWRTWWRTWGGENKRLEYIYSSSLKKMIEVPKGQEEEEGEQIFCDSPSIFASTSDTSALSLVIHTHNYCSPSPFHSRNTREGKQHEHKKRHTRE